MKQYYNEIDMRCLMLGEYISEKNATVRSAAEKYGISKSTVHTEVTVRNGKIGVALNATSPLYYNIM